MSSVGVFVRFSSKALTDGEGYQVNSVERAEGLMLTGEAHLR
jgi:hypothetical protein